MTENDLYGKMQSAYCNSHNTKSEFLRVHNDILRAVDQRTDVMLGLLDISAAFDTVDHRILLTRLMNAMASVETHSIGSVAIYIWTETLCYYRWENICCPWCRLRCASRDLPLWKIVAENNTENFTTLKITLKNNIKEHFTENNTEKEAFVIQECKKRLTYQIFIQTTYHFKS